VNQIALGEVMRSLVQVFLCVSYLLLPSRAYSEPKKLIVKVIDVNTSLPKRDGPPFVLSLQPNGKVRGVNGIAYDLADFRKLIIEDLSSPQPVFIVHLTDPNKITASTVVKTLEYVESILPKDMKSAMVFLRHD
jgi:hypothetical protein